MIIFYITKTLDLFVKGLNDDDDFYKIADIKNDFIFDDLQKSTNLLLDIDGGYVYFIDDNGKYLTGDIPVKFVGSFKILRDYHDLFTNNRQVTIPVDYYDQMRTDYDPSDMMGH